MFEIPARTFLLALVCAVQLLCANFALASNLVPHPNHAVDLKVLAEENGTNDLIKVRTPNGHGISLNQFSYFQVANRPLKLINTPSPDSLLANKGVAQTIVIVAPVTSLSGKIEIVGPAADLVIISNGAGSVTACTSCIFENVLRVTLASAKATISDLSTGLGEFETIDGGRVTVNGLNAPGAMALDLVADRVELIGAANLNMRVSPQSGGGYFRDDIGSKVMGGGTINVVNGSLGWNFDQKSIAWVDPKNETANPIAGQLFATAVNVYSSESLSFSSHVDTRTDLTTAYWYGGANRIAKEVVNVNTLKSGSISMLGTVNGNSQLVVNSSKSVTIGKAASINVPQAVIIAVEDIRNNAVVSLGSIKLAGRNIKNRNAIVADDLIEAFAEKNLINEFGGELSSENVVLQAKFGMIRNGSRTPYLNEKSEQDAALKYGTNDIVFPTHMGTFYKAGVVVDTATVRPIETQTHAIISGASVRIKAPSVENINPYWELAKDDQSIDLNILRSNQVTISGEKEVIIDAESYVLNSSGVIRVNGSSGQLALKGSIITNERYRTLSTLSQNIQQTDISNLTQTQTTAYTTRVYSYSPPGYLVTMGNLFVEASTGFVNTTAYLEAYGTGYFKTPKITDAGLQQGGIAKVDTTIYREGCARWITTYTRLIYRECVEQSLVQSGSQSTINILPTQENDSLFAVYGGLYGRWENSAVDMDIFNYSAWDWYKLVAATNVRDSVEAQAEQSVWANADWASVGVSGEFNAESSVSIEGDKIVVSTDYFVGDQEFVSDEKQQFSLWEEIKKLYEKCLAMIKSLFAEIDWWK